MTKSLRVQSRLALLAVIMGSLVSACSMNQDPYAEKSEAIRNGVPPELDRVPSAPKPRASDALRIDAGDFYTFKEQVEREVQISGRVLDPNPNFAISIQNESEFPGMEFIQEDPVTKVVDKTKGIFKWKPPRDTTGLEYGSERRLKVLLTAFPTTPGGKIEGTTKEILIFVTRAELDPEVVSFDDLTRPYPTREGESRKFNVVVRDPDSDDRDGARPRLTAVPWERGQTDISGLVYMEPSTPTSPNPVRDPANKQLWTFKMVLDLSVPANKRGRNFTPTQENFKFGLQAVTRFGRVAMKEMTATILTDVMKPEVSWFDAVEVFGGQENVIQFTAYDPYLEGKLSINFITRVDQLPGSAVAFCKPASRDGNMLCRISWRPLATTSGDFNIEFKVTNESKVAGDRKVAEETFKRTIKVLPAPIVTVPAPVPVTPAPVP